MLKHLIIQNYTLIDDLDIRFMEGYTAITGETGAGKSILMDALDLVLGKRADTQVLLDSGRKCIVEGTFDMIGDHLSSFFEENNLDKEKQIILRREINPKGKSRAFINDTPVGLNILKSLGDLLVDIHAQHSTTSLQDPAFHLSVIDSYARIENIVMSYQDKFRQLKSSQSELKELLYKEEQSRKSLDYQQFLLEELENANLSEDEQQELEDQLNVITHAEEIKSNLFQVLQNLSGEDKSVLDLMAEAETGLNKVAGYHQEISQLAERLGSGLIDLKDIVRELLHIDQGIDFNAELMSTLQERLDLIYRLQHKHHVNSCLELIFIRDNLRKEVGEVSSLEDQIQGLSKKISGLQKELEAIATNLSESRENAFDSFSRQVVSLLQHMGMPDCRFSIVRVDLPELNNYGKDKIEFYFNANKGHSLKPISDIASGGELSRVMLSIKSLISKKKMLPTIVFDEIDNGLSGDIAGRVGDVLIRMAEGIQVIAITHLPQIAGKADHQYTVFKEIKEQVTYSNIRLLDEEGRIQELARMIGGKVTSDTALAAAREMLLPSAGLSELIGNN